MARVLNLQAPKSMTLHTMRPAEVERYVSDLAEDAFKRMPDGLKPAGVNAVALAQRMPGTGGDPGVWAEWTRACCGSRNRIQDFVDPVIDQFERPDSPVLRELAGQHLESQMRIITLEHPTMHTKAD